MPLVLPNALSDLESMGLHDSVDAADVHEFAGVNVKESSGGGLCTRTSACHNLLTVTDT